MFTVSPINYKDRRFLPYAIALGRVALAWNALHQVLAHVLIYMLRAPSGLAVMAAYSSLKVDRAQRDLIKAALKEAPVTPRAREEIAWLIDQANSLADLRNDAAHAPFSLTHDPDGVLRVLPFTHLGNPRAKNLYGKDVLKQLTWFYETAIILTNHANELAAAISIVKYEQQTLPDRPKLPNRGDSKTSRRRRPTPAAKRARPPRSSRA